MSSGPLVVCTAGVAAVAWAWYLTRRQLRVDLAVEVGPVGRAVEQALSRGARDRIVEVLPRDAWVGRLVGAGIEAEELGEDPGLAMALVFRDLRAEASHRLRSLRLLARACVFTGILAGIWEYTRPQAAELGLRALVAGTAEQAASARAMECIAIGLGFAAVALAARLMLRRPARGALAECDRLRERLENRLSLAPVSRTPQGGPVP